MCVFPLVETPLASFGFTIHKAHLVKVLLALSWSEGRPGRVVLGNSSQVTSFPSKGANISYISPLKDPFQDGVPFPQGGI